jgi:hypothetical protein
MELGLKRVFKRCLGYDQLNVECGVGYNARLYSCIKAVDNDIYCHALSQ